MNLTFDSSTSLLFETPEHLTESFIQNKIDNFSSAINIGEAEYTLCEFNLNNDCLTLVYKDSKENLCTLEWVKDETGEIIASNIHFTPHSQEKTLENEDNLSLEEELVILGINNEKPFLAKIDTGADMCSLHAENIEFINSLVKFKINNDEYKMAYNDVVEIQNSEGVEKRPVVKFNVILNGKDVANVAFNLNDRSTMDHKVLIGTNLLEKTDMMIDVKEDDKTIDSSEKIFDSVSLSLPNNEEPTNGEQNEQ